MTRTKSPEGSEESTTPSQDDASNIDANDNNNKNNNNVGRDIERSLSVDSIVETLRGKLESGQGECIYKLSDSCRYSLMIV